MILKGSQRGGGLQLAIHLLNLEENDHVTVHELRGFVSRDLRGALAEAHAVSLGTRCKQFLFSLSLNPPKDSACEMDSLLEAVDRAEASLGLDGQPRAVVIHEKLGRRHAHVVWSRIDADDMKAVHLPFFKTKLAALSKELYLQHGWELPEGHRQNGWKNPLNFTLAEWQQAKRLDLDPRELKQVFQSAWTQSDGPKAFRAALEDSGYYLAAGDRRAFVAVDLHGEVFSVARMVGVKTKEIAAKLGTLDHLPSIADVHARNLERLNRNMAVMLKEGRAKHDAEREPLAAERKALLQEQRATRKQFVADGKARSSEAARKREARFRRGIGGVWDWLTGLSAKIKRQNEHEARADADRHGILREQLFRAQFEARRDLQARFDELRRAQRVERRQSIEQIAFLLKLERAEREPVERRDLGRGIRLPIS